MILDASKLAALTNWLAAGAPPQSDYVETISELARKLTDAGLVFDTLSIFGQPINPLTRGKMVTWTPKRGGYSEEWSYERMKSSQYIGSIAEAAFVSSRMLHCRLGNCPEFDEHSGTQDLIRRNYIEYLAIPLILTHEANAALGVGTRCVDGFTDEEVLALRRIAAPLARVVEAQLQQENMQVLLETYVGHDASLRVLAGKIRRGESELIPAVILFADLMGFTTLSNSKSPEVTIDVLNRFFSALDTPIRKNRGEILKLIGDGLLAIFPTPDDLTAQETAAAEAILAVNEARQALANSGIEFRASFHVGDIHYGNIGSESRLDFTAIGPSVNLASRILSAADELGSKTVCSQMFHQLVPEQSVLLKETTLKGFKDKIAIYRITD